MLTIDFENITNLISSEPAFNLGFCDLIERDIKRSVKINQCSKYLIIINFSENLIHQYLQNYKMDKRHLETFISA